MQQVDRGFRVILLAMAVLALCLAAPTPGLAQTTYSTDPLLVNQQSSMCLGVPGATFSYEQLVQWYCNGSTDQNWLPNSSSAFDSGGST
jgi:hypothetical protein